MAEETPQALRPWHHYLDTVQEHSWPSRVTVKASLGRSGIVDIERETTLSGSTHDQGVRILSATCARGLFHNPKRASVNLAKQRVCDMVFDEFLEP